MPGNNKLISENKTRKKKTALLARLKTCVYIIFNKSKVKFSSRSRRNILVNVVVAVLVVGGCHDIWLAN